MTSSIKNEAVLVAIKHVRQFFPDVNMVVYDRWGKWQFMGSNFDSVDFGGKPIDVSILEDASDSVTETPAVFQLYLDEDGMTIQNGGYKKFN